jgi:[ribosomal protein S5]-alanine N-acetyltransferase
MVKKLNVPKLEGERIVLRKFTPSDAKDLLELEVRKVKTINDAKKWIKNSVSNTGFYLAIFLKSKKKVIGYRELCHLDWWDFEAGEICVKINPHYRKRGYSTEASILLINYCFDKLKFHKVYADTDPSNKISQRNLKKMGFKLEGVIRDRRKIKGKWTDELDYGLLKPELKKALPKLKKRLKSKIKKLK